MDVQSVSYRDVLALNKPPTDSFSSRGLTVAVCTHCSCQMCRFYNTAALFFFFLYIYILFFLSMSLFPDPTHFSTLLSYL